MRIIKINDNEIEVTEERTLKDTDGNDVQVYDERNKAVYSRRKLIAELHSINSQLEFLGDSRAIERQVSSLNVIKTKLLSIESEFESDKVKV